MPQQHLDDSQIGAVIQQVRRKRVAQRVRRNWSAHASLFRVPFDELPECLPCHRLTTLGWKHRMAGTRAEYGGASVPAEPPQPVECFFSKWYQAFLAAFTNHPDEALIHRD